MEEDRILVATATKMGSTAEIGAAIAERLRSAGFVVDQQATGDVRSVEPYSAIVLGSAVYMMRWRGEAISFLSRFERELGERDVWLFQSGPLDRSAEEKTIPLPRKVGARLSRIGFRGHATFGGMIDPEHADGFVARSMAKKGKQDFRDFERIRAWGDLIASQLGAKVA